jgi:hypothetical protein
MPHKAVVVEWLDEVSAAVRAAGACNALRRSGDGKLIGAMFATDRRWRVGRRAARVRLSARDQHRNVPLAFLLSVLMWGVVYQGYNAVFPSFYPELFPTRARVSGMAIAQNIGTMMTAFLPALFATSRRRVRRTCR